MAVSPDQVKISILIMEHLTDEYGTTYLLAPPDAAWLGGPVPPVKYPLAGDRIVVWVSSSWGTAHLPGYGSGAWTVNAHLVRFKGYESLCNTR